MSACALVAVNEYCDGVATVGRPIRFVLSKSTSARTLPAMNAQKTSAADSSCTDERRIKPL